MRQKVDDEASMKFHIAIPNSGIAPSPIKRNPYHREALSSEREDDNNDTKKLYHKTDFSE